MHISNSRVAMESFILYTQAGLKVLPTILETNFENPLRHCYSCDAFSLVQEEELTEKLLAAHLDSMELERIWPLDKKVELLLPLDQNSLIAIYIRPALGQRNLQILERSLGRLPETLTADLVYAGEIRFFESTDSTDGCFSRDDLLPNFSVYARNGTIRLPKYSDFVIWNERWFNREVVVELPKAWAEYLCDGTGCFSHHIITEE